MIRNYFRMKKNEWKIKATIYNVFAYVLDNNKEVLDVLQKMYMALKDVPAEELQKEFIAKLAEIILEENKDKS